MTFDITALAAVTLDAKAPTPLYRQLYEAVRREVLAGRLVRGTRLPPTRALAEQFGVSRNTVMLAFTQLMTEGYLEGRVGAGTYVSDALPDDLLEVRGPVRAGTSHEAGRRRLSKRGAMLAATPVGVPRRVPNSMAFRVGTPDVTQFPFEEWSRIVARAWRAASPELLGYGDPAGHRPLREAIAAHVGAARAVRCTADQVIIVSGSQQALDLSSRVLLDPGDRAWIEEPGYLGARAALLAAGATLVPVSVDDEGIDVSTGVQLGADARLAYVTPSHQFPLGVTMSLARRLALLEWASANDSWIVEDDFDSEYRYAGRPLAALQGLDDAGRVIYAGTFSKVMFPALRTGYLIVPPDLIDAFVTARAISNRHPSTIEQVALAEFIAEGHLSRHIRRMRALYDARQRLLVERAQRDLRGLLDIGPCATGMHVVGWLSAGSDDDAASSRAAAAGIEATPLSAYRLGPGPPALLLGYSAVDERAIVTGVRTLAAALGSASG